jgi:putative ABC transport system permease protein
LEIATLRSLGIDPRAIYRLWLSEALLYGTLAGMAGILIGWGLSTVTIGAVSTTVRALYRDTVESAATISFSDIQLSFALAIIGSFLAAWLPARDAAETPPAQFLRIGKRIPPFSLFNHYWVGLISVVLGAALLTLPAWPASPTLNIPLGGYASAFLWLTGGTLLVVRLLKIVGTALHAIWPDSPSVRLASGRLIHPTSRHQLALAGFYVAIGMASAMSFLIGSFQHTVTSWLEHRLRADLFLSTVGFQGSEADERMPAFILDEIEADPAVEAMDRFRLISIELKNLTVGLAGSRFELLGDRQDLLWIQTPSADLRPAPNSTAGYANENLARRANLKIGDVLTINTPQGDKRITILGIHADYARDNGLLLIDLSRLIEWFGIDDFDTASVFLKDGTSILNAKEALRNRFPGLAVRDNPELKKTALSIFAQTFAVTKALQLIGIIVALSGLILSLVSLLRESDRELSLQKTLGMTRHQIAKATAVEGLGIALCGLIGGIFLSIALGYVMIFVINRQSFGWTLQSAYPVAATSLLAALILLLSWAISYATGSLFLRKWKPQSL